MATEYKKITDLTLGVELTGTEQLEMVQTGTSLKLTSDMFPLRTYPYITVSDVGLLSQGRTLTAGTGISLIDAGAGGTLTVNATGVLVSSAEFVLLAADPDLPNERVLTGTANQIILTDNGAGSTIVLSTPQDIAPTSSPTFANLTLTNPLTVPNGGTGVGTLTGLAQGNGTGVFTAVANSSTVGQVLRVTGAASYAWGAVDLADSDAVTGLLPIGNGGTGAGTKSAAFDALSPMTTLGDTIYGGASGTGTRLAGNTTTTLMFLSQTGTGVVSAAPAWSALPGSFSGFANPTASIGLAAVNGVATTAMRSDAAPLLSQTIAPTWTGVHLFNGATTATSVGTTGVSPGTRSSQPSLFLVNSAATANNRIWEEIASTTVIAFRALSDDNATAANYLVATRSGATVTDLSFGNSTNNNTYTFAGTGAATFNGPPVVSATPNPYLRIIDTAGTADQKNTLIRLGGSPAATFQIASATDAAPTTLVTAAVSFARTGSAWSTLTFGNTTDVPALNFTGTPTFSRAGTAVNGVVSAGSGVAALFEFAGNGLSAGSTSMSIGQDSGGAGQLINRNTNANINLQTNGSGAIVIGTGGTNNLTLNTVTAASANAGASGAAPAQVAGYLTTTINGTVRKIPYYAN